MSLRRRSYLVEEVKGIPFSRFKVGKKVVLQRRPLYAHDAPGTSDKETMKTIDRVVGVEDERGEDSFLMLYFKETKGRSFRTEGRDRTVRGIASYAGSRPLRYWVWDVK